MSYVFFNYGYYFTPMMKSVKLCIVVENGKIMNDPIQDRRGVLRNEQKSEMPGGAEEYKKQRIK